MPAKNGNQPQPIRYLLSADPTLKKLSLRRISVRVKNGKKLPRSIRSKEPGHAKKFMRFPWAVNTRAIVLSVPVTITGCLELDEATFWLKDAAGVDAPKSRSWRSGFLKRRSSQIELVDAANTLKLPNYVGQRVAATGTLLNREMRARSLQRLAISCG